MLEITCLNCDRPIEAPRRPFLYCSTRCAEEAGTVRYVRAVYRDSRIEREDVQEAVRIRIGMVLGGGYPAAERRLSPKIRAGIFTRDESRCRVCGASATEIDHIDACADAQVLNSPANLQAICGPCHRAKTLAGLRPASAGELAHGQRLRDRIEALTPKRVCDDEQNWKSLWRQIARERAAILKALA